MTVDMLAATFFWPEGTLLGAQPIPRDALPEDRIAEERSCEADEIAPADGFWTSVARHFWRPATASSTESVR